VTRPADAKAYHRTAVQVAESLHDGVRTGWLVGRAELDGRVFGAYTQAAFGDASDAVAGASKQFAAEAPPDPASARLRDQLTPLVTEAPRALADAQEAGDDAQLRRAVAALGRLADRLDDFIEANK
jgi:hypothetical protein